MRNFGRSMISLLLAAVLCISAVAATVVSIGKIENTFTEVDFTETKPEGEWGLYGEGYFYYSEPLFLKNMTEEKAGTVHTLFTGEFVSTIGTRAFSDFKNLRRAELSSYVTSIGDRAFTGCKIERIGIPSSVKYIDQYAFSGSSNNEMVIYCKRGSAAEKFAKEYDYAYKHASPVYHADGRMCMVTEKEEQAFLDAGWFSDPDVTMYDSHGKTQEVFYLEVEDYLAQGWALNEEDVYTTMYSADGRTLRCLKINVAANRTVGWYTEPVTPLYAPDGRMRYTIQSEISLYKTLGWYAEPVTLMYAPDGRTRVTLKNEVELYKSVGWYANRSDVYTTMYSADGRTLECLRINVEANKKVGWYTEPVVLMYAPDGRTRYTLQSEVALYQSVGWYTNRSDIYTTMYSLDGRTLECLKINVEANKKVGWYLPEDWYGAKADAYVRSDGYDTAYFFLYVCLNDAGAAEYGYVLNAMTEFCRKWSKAIGAPIAVVDAEIARTVGKHPEGEIVAVNLTQKEVRAFAIDYTCYDAYGKRIYPGGYGTASAESTYTSIAAWDYDIYNWTLTDISNAVSIGTAYATKVAYADGSTWYR